jgi:hypothetical protein
VAHNWSAPAFRCRWTGTPGRVERLLARLRQAPIPAPSATPPGELTYGEALTALKYEVLPKPEQWPLAAVLLEAAIHGDGSAIETVAAGRTGRGLGQRAVRLLADRQRRPLHRSLGRRYRQPDPGHRHPLRPQTPLNSARRAARLLGNAVLLVHDGYGHLSRRDPSACVTRATGAYLVDLTSPLPGTVCPSDRLPFDPDLGQPAP